jgi:hypothetical protein
MGLRGLINDGSVCASSASWEISCRWGQESVGRWVSQNTRICQMTTSGFDGQKIVLNGCT